MYYYIYPEQIYVLDVTSACECLLIGSGQIDRRQNLIESLASYVREEIRADKSKMVSNDKRVKEFLFLNYNQLLTFFITKLNDYDKMKLDNS